MSKRRIHRGIVVLHPKVQITKDDEQALRDAGYIPIHGEASQVTLRGPSLDVDGGALTFAALKVAADPANPMRQTQIGKEVLSAALAHYGLAYAVDGKSLVTIR